MPPTFAFAQSGLDASTGPVVIAAAVGLIALLAAAVVGRPRRDRSLREKVRLRARRFHAQDIERVLNWLPPDAVADRRRGSRRAGPGTLIRVCDTPDADSPATDEGLVLDRSTGGLCFAAHHPFAQGAVVFVRAVDAPPGSPWVGVTVRHCRDCGDHVMIGCEFLEPLPWNILLLFG
jgi:hypothetical protein